MDKKSFQSLLAAILLSGQMEATPEEVKGAVETAELILQETGKVPFPGQDNS